MNITIRRMLPNDVDALYRLLSDQAVMRYLEPPYDREQAEVFLHTAGLAEPPLVYAAEENGAADAVASAVDALLEADPFSNQFEITAMNIEYDFGLKADDVTSYKGLKSNDNGDAGLVLAIQPAAGKAQDVMDTLKTYQQDQVAFYGNYAEIAQAQSNVENAIIDGGDDLVVMVIASNDCSSDLTSAVKDVLGK